MTAGVLLAGVQCPRAYGPPRCSPGHHVGEAIPIPDLAADDPRTHACFECCEIYDPDSVEMWRELERLMAQSGESLPPTR